MDNEVYILTDAHMSGTVEMVGNYLRAAYGTDLGIYAYNYKTGVLYEWPDRVLDEKAVSSWRRIMNYSHNLYTRTLGTLLEVGDLDEAKEDPNDQVNLKVNRKLNECTIAARGNLDQKTITTVGRGLLSDQGWYSRLCRVVIDQLYRRNGKNKCFLICPNARNAPPEFLTFGHKIELRDDEKGNELIYQRVNNKGEFPIDHLRVTIDDAVCVVAEIGLCKAIIKNLNVRFIGNCYGSEIMWLALGGGLTTYKRNSSIDGSRQRFIQAEEKEYNSAEVNWDDGIYFGSDEGGKAGVNVLSYKQLEELFLDYNGGFNLLRSLASWCDEGVFTYNTDFHHSFMLVASSRTNNLDRLSTIDHKLGGDVFKYHKRINDYIRRFQKYAGGHNKYSWKGIYSYDYRIFGFQGHPLYHITNRSAPWNAVHDGEHIENEQHASNQQLIWLCLTGQVR